MELSVLNIEGKDTGKKVILSEEVFGIDPNNHLMYLAVKLYLANQRQGTHKAKEKSELSGSTRKLKRQKGTGGARAGSIKSPTMRGGSRIFGPRPRTYGFKMNRKERILARKSALTYKAKDAAITVLEDFNFETPKTKAYLSLLANLSLSGKKSLMVLSEHNENIYRSARNLPKIMVSTAAALNTYDILKADHLILCEGSVSQING
jgi:large subunit ribosomal protein L4